MHTHTYTVSEGKDVRPEFVGKEIEITSPDSVAEALSSGAFENEAAIMKAANGQRHIEIRAAIRKVLGTEGKTIEDAIAAGKAVVVKAPRVVDPNAPKKPRSAGTGLTKAAKAALDERYEMLDRLIEDGSAARQAVKLGLVKAEAIEAHRAFRAANPKAEVAPAAQVA